MRHLLACHSLYSFKLLCAEPHLLHLAPHPLELSEVLGTPHLPSPPFRADWLWSSYATRIGTESPLSYPCHCVSVEAAWRPQERVYGPYRGASGRGSELGAFTGFKARFHGEEVASYEVEKRLVYLLYRCGWGDYDGYRVHKTDERNPFDPKYELTPIDVEDPSSPNTEYHSLYEAKEIVSYFPMFARHIEFLKTRDIDPRLRR
jgi:hypothetical protein